MHPIRVNTGSRDEEGRLIFVDGRLAAVLVRLANGIHDETMHGKWFLEAGFGPFSSHAQRLFDDPEAAAVWCKSRWADCADRHSPALGKVSENALTEDPSMIDDGTCSAIKREMREKIRDLEELLCRTERLFDESRHRIKNHLQLVQGCIRLRAKETLDAEARKALNEISGRIETVHLLHEKLYSAGKADRLELGEYLGDLATSLLSFQTGGPPVRLRIEVEKAFVDPEIAVPLGLILNEFVTNSLKHAFGPRGGVIGLELCKQKDEISLRIWDNGRSLPEPPDPHNGSGIKLIHALSAQIGARLAWSSESGTVLTAVLHA